MQSQNKKTTILLVIGLLILISAYYYIDSIDVENKPTEVVKENAQVEVTVPADSNLVTETIVYKKDIKNEVKLIKVKEGQKVVIKITSDLADEAHLHGYNVSVPLEVGVEKTLEFEAKNTGRFPIELEKIALDIAIVEVYPK